MLLRHPRSGVLFGYTLFVYFLLIRQVTAQIDETISEHEGKTVILPCPIDKEKCGELHSINWFKGEERIAAMLLDDSNVTSVTSEFEDRVTVEQSPYRLVIQDLQISDEDIYLCDTTFFIPVETCDNFNGYRIELNVLVPPTEVVILDEKGDRIENGTIVGPMQERQMLKATCVVRNTRPQPQVGWWRGNRRLTTHSPSYDEKDGLYTATLELALQLSRDDLANDIECRVDSAAIPHTITNNFEVDLQVRPTSITINGVEHHTVQGSKVVLTCDIHGARPPVNITWYNSTTTISPEENDLTDIRTKAFEKPDGTYHTQSELIFNATRFENDMIFRCEAENIVLQINREKPFTSSLTLEVLYPPVVKISPPEITVNTSDTVLLNCEYVANPASLTHVVWYRNGELVNVNDTERYEGGNSENVALVIRSTDKEDIGNYTCQLSNAIGKGISEQQIDLDVQYVPIVEVLMIPDGPVKESDESNVTLFCNILDANPAVLTKVRWYANSTLLKELPDCEETREDLCHIDPSKLLLESIGRGFFFNYSCEGYNAAGWGPRSEDKELMVHYEPGPATLTHFPLIAVKKKSVIFSCSIDDPGYPESNRFRWLRGGRGPLQDIVTKDWTVEPVGLDSRTNYSCYAYNDGGKGAMATVNLDVYAPPFFIKNLPPYTGMLHSSRNANLTCRIECVPRCEISWLKDGLPIAQNDTRYFVKEKYMDASPATGDFESMLSVLHFNMSNWPNNKFDIESDNANYTCLSTANSVGTGIKSATYFSIEYAPDNTTVSEKVVYVQEDTVPGRVICKSKANPEPTYEWRFNNKTVIRGNALIINTPMTRNDNGSYTCVAYNKHGRNTAEAFIDVQFKPRCEIERREIDDQDTLICTAFGNPLEADFSWSIKAENETVEWLGNGDSKTYKDKSFYVLDEDYAIARTYRCVANNTAGAGAFCEIEVAEQLAWWQRWDKTTLIILVAAILALLLAVIIICCIIICICRRRRRQDKYHTEVSISATQSVLSYQPTIPQVGVAFPIHDTSAQLAASTSLLPPTIVVPAPPAPAAAIAQEINEHMHTLSSSSSAAPPPPPPLPPPSQTTSDKQQSTNKILTTSTSTPTPTPKPKPTTTTPTLTVKHTQAPKSPPRWPLRPGVMVHVSNDTKENLAVNRMTLKPRTTHQQQHQLSGLTANDSSLSTTTSILNISNSTAQTTLLNETLQSTTTALAHGAGDLLMNDSANISSCQQISTVKRTVQAQHNCSSGSSSMPRNIHANNDNTQTIENFNADQKDCDVNDDEENVCLTTINTTTTTNDQPNTTANSANLLLASIVTSARQNTNDINYDNDNEQDYIQQQQQQQQQQADLEAPQQTHINQTSHHKQHAKLARVESFFANIFRRAKRTDTTRDSQRSHVGLLGGVLNGAKAVFWKRTDEKSHFAKEHRLKGIRCSGSVTYKKTPVLEQRNVINASRQIDAAESLKTATTNKIPNTTTINTHTNAAVTPTQPAGIPAVIASPHNSPRSHASVTFRTPSLNKTETQAIVTTTLTTLPPAPITQHKMAIKTVNQQQQQQQQQQENQQLLQTKCSSILKSPTPPPRPPPPFRAAPPPLLKRTVVVSPLEVERVQIHDKSSSLGDPLTEPGEYENLPFHGLQTAPNKFCTTPAILNNNTNVVRVAPRPKRLNSNISHQQQQKQYFEPNHQQQLQLQQQQIQYHHHHNQYDQMQYNRAAAAATCTSQQQHKLAAATTTTMPNINLHGATNNTHNQHSINPHQIAYNLNNCFPKSYNEYYQQHQNQKCNSNPTTTTAAAAALNAQLLNAIEHEYPAYAVVERNTSIPVNTNPFLAASNFKKYDTEQTTTSSNYTPTNSVAATAGAATGSMHRNKRKGLLERCEDKKFYSLKFTGNKNKINKQNTQGLNAAMIVGNESGGSIIASVSNANKCKRHHSFAGGSIGDIDSPGTLASHANPLSHGDAGGAALMPPYMKGNSMRFYDPPVYENLTDSVQIHECEVEAHPKPYSSSSGNITGTATVILHPQPSGSGGVPTSQKKKHHHRQHQQKDDFNLMEPERLSIYRSDSGISNSSYECVTPVPLTNFQQTPDGAAMLKKNATPPPKTPKMIKAGKGGVPHSSLNAQHKKAQRIAAAAAANIGHVPPVYMNLDKNHPQHQDHYERSNSPYASTLVNSSYESASSSQNDNPGACLTDPASLSSCNSLYSSGTGTLIGSISATIGKSSSRCNRHKKPIDITTPEEYEQFQLGNHEHSASTLSVASSNVSAASGRKCKKRSNNEPAKLSTNPFLALGCSNAVSIANDCKNSKKLRRQTISDPYTHIRYINRGNNFSFTSSNNDTDRNTNEANNYCTKSPNAFKTTAAAAIKSQIELQQSPPSQQQQQQQQQRQQCYNYQQRMLMPKELLLMPQYHFEMQLQDQKIQQLQKEKAKLQELSHTNELTTTTATDPIATDANDVSYLVRPMKLPLRKHHSFHFQTSQTVAGIRNSKFQQLLRMQIQQDTHNHHHHQQQQHQQQQNDKEFVNFSTPDLLMQKPLNATDDVDMATMKTKVVNGSNYNIDESPLIFRPLTLNENRGFKPISPPDDIIATQPPPTPNEINANIIVEKETEDANEGCHHPADEDYQSDKSEITETLSDEINEINKLKTSFSLNPAASLEALEKLTQTHPDFSFATKAGSRQNLHLQISEATAMNSQYKQKQKQKDKLTDTNSKEAENVHSNNNDTDKQNNNDENEDEDEDEDLGYSFYEIAYDKRLDNYTTHDAMTLNNIGADANDNSPNNTVVLLTDRHGGHVKYISEVHI